jgi:hypothetical protein
MASAPVKSRFLPNRAGDSPFGLDNSLPADKDDKRRHHQVPTEDSFTPDHPLPLFLSRRADEHEQRGSSRLLKASALVITATASAIAIALSLGNPVKGIGDVTASLADMSGLRPRTDQSPPIIQSTQALPPTARGATSRAETAAADQGQTEISEPPSGAVLKQFQAWAAREAREDAQAQAEPAQPLQNTQAKAESEQPAQNARAQVLEDDPAPVRHIRKYRRVRTVQSARAEIRHPRARVQRHQNARVEVRPVQDARAQAQPGQNPQPPQPPSFLQSLGWQ